MTTALSKYRMVAFDLDGTLLAPNHQISDYAVQYLRSLHDKGFIVSIATGRSPAAIAEVIRRLNLAFPKSHSKSFPVVSTNGAKGIHVSHVSFDDEEEQKELTWEKNPMFDGRMTFTELFHQPVPLDLARKTLALSKSMGCVTNYYVNHEIYAQINEKWNLEATEKYTKLTGVQFTYCEDDYNDALQKGLPSKLLVLCKPEDIDEVYQKIKNALGYEAKVIRGTPPFFVEVLNKEVSKGYGLELLCESLKVGLNECIAFGDGDNDVEFIEKSGLGIAMKNARETAKAVADEITEQTNENDGAIRTLQRLESEGKLHFSA